MDGIDPLQTSSSGPGGQMTETIVFLYVIPLSTLPRAFLDFVRGSPRQLSLV